MKAKENYLLGLLSNNDVTFFIPPYQRNYEWEKDQCEVFLNDILKTTINNLNGQESEHFFGTIVFVENEAVFGEPSKLVLTDGQQRITTTMLFLVAIRDVVANDNNKNFIDGRYLKNNNISDDTEHKIKLKQVETDWEAYRNIILGINLTDDNKESSVYSNYAYFVSEINKIKQEDEIDLIDLISLGLAKFSVVTIQLQPDKYSWENPQEVFESMNSLGKPLSLADLVRNYLLLGKNPDAQDKLYRNYWLHIEKQLPGQLSNFIRDFMQLKIQKSLKIASDKNYKELYANFKYLFSDYDTEELLGELNEYSDYYSYILLGAHCGSENIDYRLNDLRTIGVTTAYSFLLGLFKSWKDGAIKEQELVGILDALIIYFLRRRILKLTQGENKNLPSLVKNIEDIVKEDDKKQATFELLANQENSMRLPNDIELANELQIMNFYNFKQHKFILSLVEEKITKSRPDKNDRMLQTEHIMPQTLNDSWKEELGEGYESVHQEYINNIGNLTLIRHNQELGNRNFSNKKGIYNNNAGLQIAKNNIVNRSKWNKNSIQHRNRWIVEFIMEKVLIIPDEMRRSNNFMQNARRGLSFVDLELVGEEINFIPQKNVVVKVIGDKEVEFEGKRWRLSPLTRELETRRGTANASGSYQGAQYWEYDGVKLAEII